MLPGQYIMSMLVPGCYYQYASTSVLPGHGRQLADSLVRDLGVVCEVQLRQQGESGEEGQPSVRHRVASGQGELAQPQTWGCGFMSISFMSFMHLEASD